ncbi:MAG TPA: DUF1801 domain-containing protein [Chryseosolibacter sp.]
MAEKTVDEMIMNLPRTEQVLVKRLRAIVSECLPAATEKAYFGMGIPYYTHHRMICFIWPASVFWGPKRTTETQNAKGTSLGFCYGNLMANEDGALLAEGRKQVYVMYFKTLSDINEAQIRALLFEASLLDDNFKKQKNKAKQTKKNRS